MPQSFIYFNSEIIWALPKGRAFRYIFLKHDIANEAPLQPSIKTMFQSQIQVFLCFKKDAASIPNASKTVTISINSQQPEYFKELHKNMSTNSVNLKP